MTCYRAMEKIISTIVSDITPSSLLIYTLKSIIIRNLLVSNLMNLKNPFTVLHQFKCIIPTTNKLHILFDCFRTIVTIRNRYTLNVDINDYISFTRFTTFKNTSLDRISCDWCSIVNGYIEYFIEIIKLCLESNLSISAEECVFISDRIISFNKYVNGFLQLGNVKITQYTPCKNVSSLFELLCDVRTGVEIIEQSYCPFKHMKSMGFHKTYYVYNSNEYNELNIVSKLLRKYGAVSCHQCARVINSERMDIVTCTDSVFQPYLDYLIKCEI